MTRALWMALLGGMTAWALHLLLSYLLADLGCRGEAWWLQPGRHALTVAAAGAVCAATLGARAWLPQCGIGEAQPAFPPSGEPRGGPQTTERQFLARVVLVLNGLFLLAIVLAGSTTLFLAPCA